MKCIYWNTKELSDLSSVLDILQHEIPDVFFLSETKEDIIVNNLKQLEALNYEYFLNPGCKRIIILKKKDLILNLGRQSTYYTTLKDNKNNVNIISVHLPSQM